MREGRRRTAGKGTEPDSLSPSPLNGVEFCVAEGFFKLRTLRMAESAREGLLVDGAGAPLAEEDSGSVELLDGTSVAYHAIAPDPHPPTT